jgi:hypothetical protein
MKMIAILLMVSSQAVASSFDYAAFQGTWLLTPETSDSECALNYRGPMTLVASAEAHTVIGKLNDGSQVEFMGIDQGPRKFNSCFSDGIIGYSETVGDGAKVTETTVYQKPGFLCSGGREESRKVYTWEIKGDTLAGTLRYSVIHVGGRTEASQKICRFKRI